MKKGYTFTFKTYLLIAFLSLLVFGAVYISPEWIWFAGFMSWTIPLVLLVQFIFCIYYIFIKTSFKVVFPLLMLALGWGHLRSTFSFHEQHSPIENDHNFDWKDYYNCHEYPYCYHFDMEIDPDIIMDYRMTNPKSKFESDFPLLICNSPNGLSL